ncbi:MAG: adenylosuccinate lyase, partial [Chitinophagaceae bacterium]|nr:adenylosuccinate lyase [Chitinophagaceae bacterium]
MELTPLTSISAIDGRYRKQVQHLDEYFSEYGLMKYRVQVEVEYLLFLEKKKIFKLPGKAAKHLQKIAEDFGPEDAQEIKQIEFTTNHDVKAVEYFLKNELEKCGGKEAKEWVHFGLTSQDINNTAIPLLWKHAIEYEYLPSLLNLNTELKLLAEEWKDIPMLAHTHGQPASPTRLGKEIMVFVERIQNQ